MTARREILKYCEILTYMEIMLTLYTVLDDSIGTVV